MSALDFIFNFVPSFSRSHSPFPAEICLIYRLNEFSRMHFREEIETADFRQFSISSQKLKKRKYCFADIEWWISDEGTKRKKKNHLQIYCGCASISYPASNLRKKRWIRSKTCTCSLYPPRASEALKSGMTRKRMYLCCVSNGAMSRRRCAQSV